MNNIVVLDSNEANKIGVLLIDYIRLESDLDDKKNEFESVLAEIANKYDEESKRFTEEKEKLSDE